jgi:acetolactate synthase-1/2/3 large subunit
MTASHLRSASAADSPVADGAATRYVSDAIVEQLIALGVKYLPFNPGSSLRGLHDSLTQLPGGPELIVCTHEEIAVAAAHAYAKATGEVGFAMVHDLVGLMHASMAVYDAWCDRAPVVVLGGGGPADPALRRPVDWFHSATTQSDLVRPFAKWAEDPITAQATLDAIVTAHRMATSDPAGPCYVTIDAAVQEQHDAGVRIREALPADSVICAPQDDLDRAVDLLLAAEFPVIVAGGVGLDEDASRLVVSLAEELGAACRDERNLTALPTAHPLNLTGDQALLGDADVILAVDPHDMNLLLGQGVNPAACVIELSLRSLAVRPWSHAGTAVFPVGQRLVAEPRTALAALLNTTRPRSTARHREQREIRVHRIRTRHERLRTRQRARLGSPGSGRAIPVAVLVDETYRAVAHLPWLLTLRNTRSWPEGIWEFDGGGRYLGHSGGGGMGYGPGALLGGGLAARDRGDFAVGIVGDGDLLFAPGALWSAVHHRVPMLVVVNNNRTYLNDEEHQRHIAGVRGRDGATAAVGTTIDDPEVDFAALGRSLGAWAVGPVAHPDDLRTALAAAVGHVLDGEVAVVDVRTEKS